VRHTLDMGWAVGHPCVSPTSVRSQAAQEVITGKQRPRSSAALSHAEPGIIRHRRSTRHRCILQATGVATKWYWPLQAARRAEPGRTAWLSCFCKRQAPVCLGGLMDSVVQTSFDGTGLHQLGKLVVQHHIWHNDETPSLHLSNTRIVPTHRGTSLLGAWFSGGLGNVGLVVGLDDLKGLFQPKWFYDVQHAAFLQDTEFSVDSLLKLTTLGNNRLPVQQPKSRKQRHQPSHIMQSRRRSTIWHGAKYGCVTTPEGCSDSAKGKHWHWKFGVSPQLCFVVATTWSS